MAPLFALLPNLGLPELLVIGVVVLLLFGSRIPSLMRSMGRGVVEFKKGVNGIEDDSPNDTGAVNGGADRESAPVNARRS